MATRKAPRKGSLQFWPRKRASKFLPRVNWEILPQDNSVKLQGFICYKAGMKSAYVKDNTPDSMTKGKGIVVPVTVLECPTMRIYSVRFYKNGIVAKDVLAESFDKELKRKVRMPKKKHEFGKVNHEDYDNVKIIIYSQVKKIGLKKTPDLSEVALSGSLQEKINFIKENLHKEFSISDFFGKGELIDVRGLTRGKGLQGPVRRFGITLKFHKSEKGVRRPGSLGPWHPARTTFRAPMAGQLGMFTRVVYNNKILGIVKHTEKKELNNIKNYGNVHGDYIVLAGSVQGTAKRQLLITRSFRPTVKQSKKNMEFVELR
ncbi:MAG: 50S ribosomal protein L3 [Nanoarchaeota archaeon]